MARKTPELAYARDQDITSEISGHERCRGDLFVGQGLRIRGVVHGNIEPLTQDTTLIVASGGHVEGQIQATRARIEGSVTGGLEIAGHLEITATAVIAGDITYGSLSIARGARLQGKLQRREFELDQ